MKSGPLVFYWFWNLTFFYAFNLSFNNMGVKLYPRFYFILLGLIIFFQDSFNLFFFPDKFL